MDRRLLLIPITLTLLLVDVLAFLKVIPILIERGPIELWGNQKLTGTLFFSITFFGLFVSLGSFMIVLGVAGRLGYGFGIKEKNMPGILTMMIFLASGFLMWYFPVFLIAFAITFVYLAITKFH